MAEFKKDLTEGSVTKQLIIFSIPFLLSYLLQSLYSLVDMMIVGRFSDAAGISAVANGYNVIWIVNGPITGITMAGTVFIAQYIGSKRIKDLKETIGTIFFLFGLLALIIMIGLLLFSGPALKAISTPAEAFGQARTYVVICTLGMLFSYGYNAVCAILRGMGDSKNPLIFISIACIANVLLDLLFIGVFKMGAVGAAYANVAAQTLSLVISIIFLKINGFVFDFKPRSFMPRRDKTLEILKIGLPLALMETIINISFLMINAIVNRLGVIPSAAIGVAGRFDVFAMLLSTAMSMSMAAMVGQNIGAGQYERAKKVLKVGLQITLVFACALFIWAQIFPGSIMAIFTSDKEIIAAGSQYIRSASLEFIMVAAVFPMNGFFNGCGHTKFTMINGLLATLLVRAPLAYILGITLGTGLFGIGFAAPLASLFSIILGIWYYAANKWKKAKLDAGTPLGA